MSNCPTCGAPKPNDDWDWSNDWLPRPGCSPESTSVFRGMASEEAYRLFAAAPKLLDALKMLLADMEWVCRERPKWMATHYSGVSLDIARDIIAMAEKGRDE